MVDPKGAEVLLVLSPISPNIPPLALDPPKLPPLPDPNIEGVPAVVVWPWLDGAEVLFGVKKFEPNGLALEPWVLFCSGPLLKLNPVDPVLFPPPNRFPVLLLPLPAPPIVELFCPVLAPNIDGFWLSLVVTPALPKIPPLDEDVLFGMDPNIELGVLLVLPNRLEPLPPLVAGAPKLNLGGSDIVACNGCKGLQFWNAALDRDYDV